MRLIDADALKKEFGFTKSKTVMQIIDNAPTITPDMAQVLAYECGKENASPRGEWIIDGHHYRCSRCGKTLAIMFSETDDDDLIGCPFCLADMRGDVEDKEEGETK